MLGLEEGNNLEPIFLTSLRRNLFKFVDGVSKKAFQMKLKGKAGQLEIILEGKKSKLG